jgi:hypothetical protein
MRASCAEVLREEPFRLFFPLGVALIAGGMC